MSMDTSTSDRDLFDMVGDPIKPTSTQANVRFYTGDLLTSRMEAIGHGCNTFGVMGAGVAKVIRGIYPQVFAPYAAACAAKIFVPGSMLPIKVNESRWVLNMASQDAPGPNARLDWLSESIDAAFSFVQEQGLSGFAIPRIGAGIGGLLWADVLCEIETVAARYPRVIIEIWTL